MTTTQDPDSPATDDDLNDAERELLEAATVGEPVDLRTGDVDLDDPANAVNWDDSRKVRADFLADMLTGDQPTSTGRLRSVKLLGARITGTLDLEARKLLRPVLLQECCFDEPVNLYEAEAVSIRCPGCHVPGLNAEQLRTVGNVEFNDGFTARGEIRLLGAHIGGQLVLNGASLTNPDGPALKADSLTTGQSMFCAKGLTAHGEIRLLGAHIGGTLSFRSASLTSSNGPALHADRLSVDESMLCSNGFIARGEIRLLGAHIGGQLVLNGASLTNPDGPALKANRLKVDQQMSCHALTAQGEVRMPGARIGEYLDLSGAELTNNSGPALTADGLTVDGGMFCGKHFTAQGGTRLSGARIGGQLSLSGAELTSDDGSALTADNLVVDRDMFCDNGFTAHDGINLAGARVGVLWDDQPSWPRAVYLGGFVYGSLGNPDVSVHARLRWLRLHTGRFTPQIYDQLADVYRRAGDESAARKVLIAKQWRRRKPYNPLSWLWWVTVGYGYRTWQAFIWVAVLTVIGALVFSGAYPAHMIKLTTHPPRFQPVIYALDVLLPIGGLGQKSAWQPTGGYLDWYWALAIAGWVLSAAVVAGLTGILKRD